MEDLVVPQIHLIKIQSSMSMEEEMEGQEVPDHHRHLGASRGPRKIMLVDVILVTCFREILISNTYFPYLLGRDTT